MKNMLKPCVLCAVCLALWCSGRMPGYAQTQPGVTAAAAAFADEEFRRGVQAYYRGSFNDAVFQFEKTLSYIPGNNLTLDWLGRAYYRSGLEGAAIRQWSHAADAGYGGQLLKSRIEIVKNRRITGDSFDSNTRFVDAGVFPGQSGEILYYSQPVSVLPLPDGSCWVLAYGSNELVRFSVNGSMIERIRGPLNGFDRPMDIIRLSDGRMAVTEYAGDRVSLLTAAGQYITSFGSKGRGDGSFLGPQYIARNSSDNLYITDFGNARVSVFSAAGEFLFSFGKKTAGFAGFKAPSGIACLNGFVYVADSVTGAVYIFDESGNYIDILVRNNTLVRPEAMKDADGRYLLVADAGKVQAVDTLNGAVYTAAVATANNPRITCAAGDINGNLIVADFSENEVYVMTKIPELAGGLFVQIDRVYSDRFPEVQLDIRVENLHRGSITGLQEGNFFVSEEKRPVSEQKLTGAAYKNDACDITILIDRAANTAGYTDAIQSAVREIAAAMNGKGTLRIVSAGSVPVPEASGNPRSFADFSAAALKTKPAGTVSLDLGIRLAANDLVFAEPKRAVIYLACPERDDVSGGSWAANHTFSKYGLADLTAYLNNNSIQFVSLNLTQNALPAEMNYITSQTGGGQYYVYRKEGLSGIVGDIVSSPSGLYRISYISHLPTDFGRRFLPVEIEVYLQNRSGRDESGYFSPLQ